jgi:hypothetical protein
LISPPEQQWCFAGPDAHAACFGDPSFGEDGMKYCILHYPGEKSAWDFSQAIRAKLEASDFNFHGTWFPGPYDTLFRNRSYSKKVDLSYCNFQTGMIFRSCTFEQGVDFSRSIFSRTMDFGSSKFEVAADFSGVVFQDQVDFSGVEFKCSTTFKSAKFNELATFAAGFSQDANFNEAEFDNLAEFTDSEFNGEVSFIGAAFHGSADFRNVTFDGPVSFDISLIQELKFGQFDGGREVFGDKSTLSLEDAYIENPERVSFYSTKLKPGWFINVDASKFDFTNVSWSDKAIKKNISSYGPSHQLLAVAYRRLAINAEENHRYAEASDFRYLAMDVAWFRVPFRRVAFWKLTWWYWLGSGYGERVFQAFAMVLVIWIFFAFLYCWVGFDRWKPSVPTKETTKIVAQDKIGTPLGFGQAVFYSAGVITLQKPEPGPSTPTAKALVLLETVLGPIQAALLALAIRRKFIR